MGLESEIVVSTATMEKREDGALVVSSEAEIVKKIITETRRNQGRIVILVSQVDPDAIGSALGLKAILKRLANPPAMSLDPGSELEVLIAFCGEFAHPQNRAINNRLDLVNSGAMIPLSKLTISPGDTLALVDSSSFDDQRFPEALRQQLGQQCRIVIDHHRGFDRALLKSQNLLIKVQDMGAASTLVVELGEEVDEDRNVGNFFGNEEGTALALGIYNDTGGLLEAREADFQAFQSLISLAIVNKRQFNELNKCAMPPGYFRTLAHALEHQLIIDGTWLVNAGRLQPNEGDYLSSIADDLIRRGDTHTVIVFALIGKTVRVSVRCEDLTVELNQQIRQWFGSGGAKNTQSGKSIGGASLSLELGPWASNDKDVQEATGAMVWARMREWIFGSATA